MNGFLAILKRELQGAFTSPLAYLFIVTYAVLTTIGTFEIGDLLAGGQADLSNCFTIQIWLLVWLTPALTMRLWAEERRQGTIELLLTRPINLSTIVVAKWTAAVVLLIVALLTTFPLWATVLFLGHPDHGAIVSAYFGTLLLGAALLSLGSALSAASRNQVSAYVATACSGSVVLLAGHPIMAEFARDRMPTVLIETIADLGALSHHHALARGVIGLADVVYFLALSMAGLFATAVVLNRIRDLPLVLFKRRVPPGLTAVGILIAVLLVSIGAPRLLGRARFDLTEESLYTLSPASQRLLNNIEHPLTLTLYASSRTLTAAPSYATQAGRIRELLADMSARARDKIHFSVIDPAPFSDDEDHASEIGLRSIPVGEAGDSLWLGLVAESDVGHASIDLFEPSQAAFLEYRIARLIRQVARPHRATVGLISTLPTGAIIGSSAIPGHPAWAIDDELREQYDVRDILPSDTALPKDLAALLIWHPKGVSPQLLTAIDQFIANGGHAFVAVDPDAQFDSEQDDPSVGTDHASTLEPLLRTWGLNFDPTVAVGDLDNALLIGSGRGDRPVRHLGFSGFGRESLAANDPLTSGLHRLDFATPGFLSVHVPTGVSATTLIETSVSSAPIKVADLAFGATPETLRHGFHPTGQRYIIATHLRGPLPSAFSGSAAKQKKSADVIVIADTDWLADLLWIRDQEINGTRYREPWANNGDFLLNAVDELTGGEDLIGLRGREPKARPFVRLDDIRNRADRRLSAQSEALEQKLAEANRHIADLTGNVTGGTATNPQQRGELAAAELERRRIVRALRGVRHDLDREAARLGHWIYAIDLLLAPLTLLFTALIVLGRRQRRAET